MEQLPTALSCCVCTGRGRSIGKLQAFISQTMYKVILYSLCHLIKKKKQTTKDKCSPREDRGYLTKVLSAVFFMMHVGLSYYK